MTETKDVVELLQEQHQHIRSLFDRVEQAPQAERQQAFEDLRRFLAVHETAEELVVHPRVRAVQGGDEVADARLQEEHDAKELLEELDSMDAGHPTFGTKLTALKASVLAHAEAEEREELPLLRANSDEKTLETMAAAVRAAEAMAPTHPHAGVESATANVVAGPLASLVDRTRDAVQAVLHRG